MRIPRRGRRRLVLCLPGWHSARRSFMFVSFLMIKKALVGFFILCISVFVVGGFSTCFPFVCKLLHVSTSGVHHRQLHKHPCLHMSDMVHSCIVSCVRTLFVAQSRGLAERVSVRGIIQNTQWNFVFSRIGTILSP